MSIQKPSTPKGVRDFSPEVMNRRNYIFDTLKKVFQKYGYMPIETPAMENLSTLMGKYGEEGDKLLFKIINSGDYLKGIPVNVEKANYKELTKYISEKGLKYDLTVPLARYVVEHRNEIVFPFKRYQIQPVWRADKPQKGRYREFYQCDVDVVGSNSLLNEVELLQIIDEVFKKLNIPVTIKINNRKILYGIAEAIGETDKLNDITVAIDKLEKVGIDAVKAELKEKGLSENTINKLISILDFGPDRTLLSNPDIVKNSKMGRDGIEETQKILDYCDKLEINNIKFVSILARGLDYYTGTIIEVIANDVKIGSICGGGRYDDLTGLFGLPDVGAIGISFGADRIYDVMNELNLFDKDIDVFTKYLFTNTSETDFQESFSLMTEIRNNKISAEIYPDEKKDDKQIKYARDKKIPYVVFIYKNGTVKLHKTVTQEWETMNIDKLKEFIKNTPSAL